jgi:hypothetical protein
LRVWVRTGPCLLEIICYVSIATQKKKEEKKKKKKREEEEEAELILFIQYNVMDTAWITI